MYTKSRSRWRSHGKTFDLFHEEKPNPRTGSFVYIVWSFPFVMNHSCHVIPKVGGKWRYWPIGNTSLVVRVDMYHRNVWWSPCHSYFSLQPLISLLSLHWTTGLHEYPFRFLFVFHFPLNSCQNLNYRLPGRGLSVIWKNIEMETSTTRSRLHRRDQYTKDVYEVSNEDLNWKGFSEGTWDIECF